MAARGRATGGQTRTSRRRGRSPHRGGAGNGRCLSAASGVQPPALLGTLAGKPRHPLLGVTPSCTHSHRPFPRPVFFLLIQRRNKARNLLKPALPEPVPPFGAPEVA